MEPLREKPNQGQATDVPKRVRRLRRGQISVHVAPVTAGARRDRSLAITPQSRAVRPAPAQPVAGHPGALRPERACSCQAPTDLAVSPALSARRPGRRPASRAPAGAQWQANVAMTAYFGQVGQASSPVSATARHGASPEPSPPLTRLRSMSASTRRVCLRSTSFRGVFFMVLQSRSARGRRTPGAPAQGAAASSARVRQ